MAPDPGERVHVEVDGHRVALHLLELGLACCGIEVRAGRRLAEATGQLVGADLAGGDLPADLPADVTAADPGGSGSAGSAGSQAEFGSARHPAGSQPESGSAGSQPEFGTARHHVASGSVSAGLESAEPDAGELNLLVVAGTVTARLAPAVRTAWEALPEPRAVLAFGACTATGGPYWDSYAVVPGAHELVPVAAWVPGCPPRPQELVDGIREVLRGRP